MSSEPKVPELIVLYAMISRMRAHSSPRVVACADEIMRVTIDTFKSPNKTASQFDELVKSDAGFEPLKNFQRGSTRGIGDQRLVAGSGHQTMIVTSSRPDARLGCQKSRQVFPTSLKAARFLPNPDVHGRERNVRFTSTRDIAPCLKCAKSGHSKRWLG
jgi:hypothetical protein